MVRPGARRLRRRSSYPERTVRRWAADGEIPPGVAKDLAALCRRQAGASTKLAEQLEAQG
jgi:hypothetical protein